MRYTEAIDYLYSLGYFKINLGLKRIRALLKSLGNPERQLRMVHVAGTNGKGSVCAMLASVLGEAGYETGRYTSPHLQRFTERMTINSREISQKEVVELVERVKPVADNIKPTFFEAVTAMAFLYFKDVDFAVMEVGLGGRLDATNVANSMISIITNISREHTKYLGEDLRNIAREKAGIIKPKSIAITGARGVALEEIKRIAKEKRTFLFSPAAKMDYELALKGEFQKDNAKLVIACVDQLRRLGYEISSEALGRGLKRASWPGRMEFIDNFLLDCAHNPAGIKVLIREIKRLRFKKLILIFGVSDDKDYRRMLTPLLQLADLVILTKANVARAMEPERLAAGVKNCLIARSVKEAVELAMKKARKNDLILATGSIFVVGEARDLLVNKEESRLFPCHSFTLI